MRSKADRFTKLNGEWRAGFSLSAAAKMAGISDAVLTLWIDTGRFTPSIENRDPGAKVLLGWNRFSLTKQDVTRLRKLVESNVADREKVATEHVKGSDYTVQELTALWNIGVDKIRELFMDEPGVIKIQKPKKRGRRTYVTLRIPEAVAERVRRRLA